MATITEHYLGDLHVECRHNASGSIIVTDAPVDNKGKGEAFSPTDLCAASLGACCMTIIGIYARENNLDVTGTAIEVTKIMSKELPRRIARIEVTFNMPDREYSEHDRLMMENCAATSPVYYSLNKDIEQVFTFNWHKGK